MWEFQLAGGDPEEVPEFMEIINRRKMVKKVKLAQLTNEEYETYTTFFDNILKKKK